MTAAELIQHCAELQRRDEVLCAPLGRVVDKLLDCKLCKRNVLLSYCQEPKCLEPTGTP